MRKILLVCWSVMACLFFTSCATQSETTAAAPRFQEGRRADVVLRFSSWDYTFMSKPFYAENGFLQQVRRETLNDVLGRFQVKRDLAVVVVGWQYRDAELEQLVTDWKNILGACDFRRVVVLRAGKTSELNGSIIVEDARFPIRTAQVVAP